MAKAKKIRPLTLTEDDVKRLEGLAGSLAVTDSAERPKSTAVELIAQHLGIRRRVIEDWVQLVRPMTLRNVDGITERFFDVYERIAVLQSEVLVGRLWDSTKVGQRDAFKAITWLLPRVDPERFGEQSEKEDDDDVFDTSGVRQEVFDALTEAEHARIDELRKVVETAMASYENLIKIAESRVLAAEIEERQQAIDSATPVA